MSQDFANVVSFQSFPQNVNNNEYIVFDEVNTSDFTIDGTKLVCQNPGTWNFLAQYRFVSYETSVDKVLSQVDGWVKVNGVDIQNSDTSNCIINAGDVNVLDIGYIVELNLDDTVEWGIRTSQYNSDKVLCGIESYLSNSGINEPSINLIVTKVNAVTEGYKNYANISSNIDYPTTVNKNEYISLTNVDTNDFSLNGSKLICNNAGTWSLNARYQCFSYTTTDLDVQSQIEGWITINGIHIEYNQYSNASWSSTLINEVGVISICTDLFLQEGDYIEFGVRSSSLDNKINNGIVNYVAPTSVIAPSISLNVYKLNILLNIGDLVITPRPPLSYVAKIYNMNITKLVIEQIKSILISNSNDPNIVNEYNFYSKNNSTLIMQQQNSSVVVDYGQFTEEQIVSNDPIYNNYLREKINELFDIVYKPVIQESSKGNIVIVHGAWHSGPLLEETAQYLRDDGWAVYTPTIRGNKPGDNRANIDLTQAIQSIVDYIVELNLLNVILVGHSYGGMVITGVVDKILTRIKRLVYWNAFVPFNGQALVDMTPPNYNALFEQLAKENDNAIILPFPIWREAFINYADFTLAEQAWNELNPHPYFTFTEKLYFNNFQELASLNIGKSYINGLADLALPQSQGWCPRLSERLGLFRYINHLYDHEICFDYPKVLAECIIQAGRD